MGSTAETRAALQQASTASTPPVLFAANENPVLQILYAIVPDNPLRAAAQGEMLAFMFFALDVRYWYCAISTSEDGAAHERARRTVRSGDATD